MEEVMLGFSDGEELMARKHVPRKFCIEGLLPQGVCILGGYPKAGKSLLVMDWALHVAKGIPVWGMAVTQGTVLYMCLEDTEDRLRQRLSMMTDEVPKSICFATAVGPLSDTLERQIDYFMRVRPDTVLIVIDTLQLVRTSSGDPTYGGDYTEVQKLKQIADRHGITLLLVHHLRKQGDPNPFNRMSGTTGLTGAADNLFVLERMEKELHTAQLRCSGRDIGDRVLTLKFSQTRFVWELVSDSAENPAVVLPAELDALCRYMEEVKHYRGGNQELCKRIQEKTGVSATPKGLKQKMNVWKNILAEKGLTYESRKANGERTVEVCYAAEVAQVAEGTQDHGAAENPFLSSLEAPVKP